MRNQNATKITIATIGAIAMATESGSWHKSVSAKQLRPAVPSTHQNDASDSNGKVVQLSPNGRPTKYREEYAQMLFDFFNIEVEKIINIEVMDKDGVIRNEKKVVVNTFPMFARFASKINVSRDTLLDWATAKNFDGTLRRPEFSGAYARAKDLQKALLIEGGISGAYESGFACRMSMRLLGWKHKT